jgi:hypothetical protein
VVTTSDVAALAQIFEDGVNVVMLERQLGDGLRATVGALVATEGFERKLVITPHQPEQVLGLDAALGDDVAFWADVLADLTGAELIGVRLARCDRAMCPRFHVDRVLVRICIAYAGAGTEYLADADADRRFLGFAAGGQSDETSGLLRKGAQIMRAPTGAVVLLKGEAWPENVGRGAIHRSPSVASDTPRLVLTLDALG